MVLAIPGQTYPKRRLTQLTSAAIALILHIFLISTGYWLTSQDEVDQAERGKAENLKVKVNVIENRRQQIVETPQMPTEAPLAEAFKGAQDHRTDKETKLPPSRHRQGAPATRYSSRSSASPANEAESQPKSSSEARSKTPAGEGPASSSQGKPQSDQGQQTGQAYANLLPNDNDFAGYYNDYIPDDSIETGDVLDVNTTRYEFIGYFTAVRKQVDFAYYDPRSSLREMPRIREQLVKTGQVSFQGVSVAQLTVRRSGLLIDSKIVKSSGDAELDQTWLRILNMAAPYPPLPNHYEGEELVFNYSLYYDIAIRDNRRVRRFHF
jgi:TonB family protein